MTESKKLYRLSQLGTALENWFEDRFQGQLFWVRAEIAQISFANSGHVYLELTEEENGLRKASFRASIWRDRHQLIKAKLQEHHSAILQQGSEIALQCSINFHKVFGLQLHIQDIDLNFSLGAAEQRKQETLKYLQKNGLLALNKGIPESLVWQRIALISSPQAAALKDFLEHLQGNEFGYRFKVKLFPAQVQGAKAAQELRTALTRIPSQDFDLIAFIRGGGSQLDLEAFNDKALCEAAARSTLPIATGIGHQSDLSLLDMVAKSPHITPTALADYLIDKMQAYQKKLELMIAQVGRSALQIIRQKDEHLNFELSQVKNAPLHWIQTLRGDIHRQANGIIRRSASFLNQHEEELRRTKQGLEDYPKRLLEKQRIELAHQEKQLSDRTAHYLLQYQKNLHQLNQLLQSLGPAQTLKRGFSITRQNEKALRSVEHLQIGDEIETEFAQGKVLSTLTKIIDHEQKED